MKPGTLPEAPTAAGRTSVAVAGGCVSILIITVLVGLVPPARFVVFGQPAEALSYQKGQTIDLPRSVYSATPRTLVVFLRAGCAPSERSVDSLGDLVRAASAQGASLKVIVGATPDDEELATRLRAQASVLSLALSSLRLKRVPAMALVDQDGTILSFSEGPLPRAESAAAAAAPAASATASIAP